ncbi:hypothetical protein ACFWUW_24230 [Streptomyces sp. NPDC058655]|uniref:hypothetical protein n=1 Tax=Streptomyces sp. NPDC058655 TaxID=3346577 RepID=UPI00365D3221
MIDDEERILTEALGAAGALGGGSGGRFGARFAAKRLRTDVHEIDLELEAPLDAAVEHVVGVLAPLGGLVEAGSVRESAAGPVVRVVRAVVGGGFANMNPVVVTVSLSAAGQRTTAVSVRGAAKEGLVRQRAGEKTAKRIAGLLAQPKG